MTDAELVAGFHRLLNPLRMTLIYQGLGGNEIGDETVLFHHMGGGGSDMTTVGDLRALIGDEREHINQLDTQKED